MNKYTPGIIVYDWYGDCKDILIQLGYYPSSEPVYEDLHILIDVLMDRDLNLMIKNHDGAVSIAVSKTNFSQM